MPPREPECPNLTFFWYESAWRLGRGTLETGVLRMGRTKFSEEAGVKLSSQLVVKKIWYRLNGGCGRRACYPCIRNKGKGISCRAEGVCYEIVCNLCSKEEKRTVYIGESSRSGYERIFEHMVLFKGKKEGDPEKQQQNNVCRDTPSQLIEASWRLMTGRWSWWAPTDPP